MDTFTTATRPKPQFTLSKQDSAFLKGIAILLIVIHNFSHSIPGLIQENEYTFTLAKSLQLLDLFEGGFVGKHFTLNFFSHYGHYGVSLFLFLSGYGLVSKYERDREIDKSPTSALRFIFSEMKKMWGLMIPGILIAILLTWAFGELNPNIHAYSVGALLTFTTNLIMYNRPSIYGVWWFFSLMVQFYVGYRLFFYFFRSERLLWAIVILSLLLQIGLMLSNKNIEYLRFNAIGWLLPFALGLSTARNPQILTSIYRDRERGAFFVTAFCLILWLVSAFESTLWLLSPLFFLGFTIPLVRWVSNANYRKALEWVGYISPALFVLHPIIRGIMLPSAIANYEGQNFLLFYAQITLFVILSLLAAWIFMLAKERISTKVK